MTLASERRAERAARTRSLRDGRRDSKARRSTAEKDAERADRNVETLVQRRNGLPSFTHARKQCTHVDANNPLRAFVQSIRDVFVFGCALRTKAAKPPRVGEFITLAEYNGGVSARYVVVECRAISSRMFEVATAIV